MLTTVKLAHLLCEDKDKRQKIADLVAYMENNRDGLYGSRSPKDKVKAEKVWYAAPERWRKILM